MNIVTSDEELLMLLHSVDPFNNQRMTYSEVVHLLSSHMVPGETQQMIPVLERFVNEQHAEFEDSEEMSELERDVNQSNFDQGDFPESRVDEYDPGMQSHDNF